MAKLIGTAGHVDHGKTTLIQALTGIDADRLPEEKRRGMTIDIGFAFIDLPTSGRVSIVDVPGHERFLSNMLVGAQGIDVALLCIASDEAVKPQTREHLAFLELLPVEKLVVALTRADLADADTRELSRLDAEEMLAETRFKDSPIVFVSAISNEGIEELKFALDDALNHTTPRSLAPWRLPVDRAFTIKGHGAVVTGTLGGDGVAVGDEAIIQPEGHRVRIRAIQTHGENVESAKPGKRVALNFSGAKLEDLHRGQIVGRPGTVFASDLIDCRMKIVGELKHGARIRVSIGAEEAIGKAFLSENEPELVQLRLEQRVACTVGQPVILRRYSPPNLLAGGWVEVPEATKRKRSEKAQQAIVVESLDQAVLQLLNGAPSGMKTEDICRLVGRSAQEMGGVFEQLSEQDKVFGFAGIWFDAANYDRASDRFLTALDELHQAKPMVGAHPREAVFASIKWHVAGKPLDRLIQKWAQDGKIVAEGTMIRAAEFRIKLNPNQRQFLDRLKVQLVEKGIANPSAGEMAQALHVPIQAVQEIARLGVAAGELAAVGEGIGYVRQWLEDFKETMYEAYGAQPFTAGEFRDKFETSRKFVIPLLEFYDAQGFTIRIGDKRAIRKEKP